MHVHASLQVALLGDRNSVGLLSPGAISMEYLNRCSDGRGPDSFQCLVPGGTWVASLQVLGWGILEMNSGEGEPRWRCFPDTLAWPAYHFLQGPLCPGRPLIDFIPQVANCWAHRTLWTLQPFTVRCVPAAPSETRPAVPLQSPVSIQKNV